MIGVLKRMFSKSTTRIPVLPLDIEGPPEWTDDDALHLYAFMQCSVSGDHLRKILTAELYIRSVTPGLKDAYAQGVHDGQAILLGRILSLAKDKEPEDVE